MTYAGRLDPQQLDAESISGRAIGGAPASSDARHRSDEPEPSFLYSNQSNWYPRPRPSHYATATLRITVPDSLRVRGERRTCSLGRRLTVPPKGRRTAHRRSTCSTRSSRCATSAFVVSRTRQTDSAERCHVGPLQLAVSRPIRGTEPRGRDGGRARRRHRALLLSRFSTTLPIRASRWRSSKRSARRPQSRLFRRRSTSRRRRCAAFSVRATTRRRSEHFRISSWRTSWRTSGGDRRSAGATITSSG